MSIKKKKNWEQKQHQQPLWHKVHSQFKSDNIHITKQSVTFAQAIEGSWVNLPWEGELLVDGEKEQVTSAKPADDANAGRKAASQPLCAPPPQTRLHHEDAHLHSVQRWLGSAPSSSMGHCLCPGSAQRGGLQAGALVHAEPQRGASIYLFIPSQPVSSACSHMSS